MNYQDFSDLFTETIDPQTRDDNGMALAKLIDAAVHWESPKIGWDSPDWSILDDRRGALPEFPMEIFDDRWRGWLTGAARGAGVLPDHVVCPLLAISSCLVGAARRIQACRSWSEPIALWTALVGFSGTGKTPGLGVVTRALSAIARAQRDKIGDLRRSHKRRAEIAKAAAKKWKGEVAKAIEAGASVPDMPADAMDVGEFIAPRLYCSDVTIERLAVLLQARPNGMSIVCDELAGLFLNMGRYNGGSDREFWLKAWNGSDHIVERQGRPPVVLDHLLVAITGGFQPTKLAKSFADDDDGMYARCLFAWPLEPKYERLSNDFAEVEPEFQNALARLAGMPTDADGEFAPKSIWLSDDAVTEFEHFRQFLHDVRDGYDGREREWMAKGPGQVLRLAGTLALLNWAMSCSATIWLRTAAIRV